MSANSRGRIYDYRIREQIVRTGDPDLFPELDIPRGTALTWIRRGMPDVVWLDQPDDDNARLRERIAGLDRRVAVLTALLRLVLTVLRISGIQLGRVTVRAHRQALLYALGHATRVMSMRAALRVLGVSSSCVAEWKGAQTPCELAEQSACPMPHPQRLSAKERMSIKDMVLSTAYCHMSIRALALHAQRMRTVFAHPSTWGKLIREHGWRRPRLRMYPAKPKEGVQATRPNEKWHIDASVLRLLDGSKVYLHAVIDNFSRKSLPWQVADSLHPLSTCEVLQEAARNLHRDESVQVVCDSGVENFNGAVDAVIEKFDWERIRALVDVTYSNSKIEARWRSLKHQWLYLNQLNTIADVRRLTKFYVDEHNRVLPHAAFQGQTPDEMYFGTGAHVVDELKTKREQARRQRLIENRRTRCGICPRAPDAAGKVAA